MLKNLLGQNSQVKASKGKGANDANSLKASNLLDKSGKGLTAQEKKGLNKEFSKLLNEGQPRGKNKGQNNFLATNVAKEIRPNLKDSSKANLAQNAKQGIESESLNQLSKKANSALKSTPKSLFSTISNQANASKSDIDSVLDTKNIVSLQKAKTVLANRKTQGSQKETLLTDKDLPRVASKGIKSQAELGTNTKAVLDDISKTDSSVKNDVLLRMPNKSLEKGKASKLNLSHQTSDAFVANRSFAGNNQVKNMANNIGLNKFSKEANLKNDSLIKVKPETMKSSQNSVSLEDILGQETPKSENRSSSLQNNLIGALGADNSASNFKAQINLAKAPEVLDLSAVTNSDQIIQEVTNYIEMNRIENGKSLQMLVKHDQLGHFNITANKEMNGMVALNIEAQSVEAKEFFKENEVKLLKNLDMKGIRVADFKIQTATSGQMSDTASQSDSFNKEKKDSERRFDAQADKISTLENSGNEFDSARQLDSEDSLTFDKNARERRQQRWQEYSQRIGA
ncbi:hypothetical protein DAY19_02330 [Halobacteriovorax vibrionivorans]|uniref:Flagellar hook-length control protein-like C-terminal domain-containing protein n=1 Tax=Halobacteriovorax vibrionivorans TaxID=2152716 RepID=A0ABY0II56_9BACT|nr:MULTISPECIES: hypothetical protein [Halobacteriovorax]RZF22631.1 hypothetical protein DAY19_02330 [Halobacteriovorax vibrionivorans]TGD47851.1 hypothetical protein EP118_06425 [Halobacteriovorax sp. Y22]